MYSITVTIGRNVGDVPMSDQRWREFKSDAIHTLDNSALRGEQDATIETAEGVGIWHGEAEANFKVTSLTNHAFTDEAVATISRDLSELARFYDQDAIALTIGTSTLC